LENSNHILTAGEEKMSDIAQGYLATVALYWNGSGELEYKRDGRLLKVIVGQL
jgi:hypothetical protein